MLANREGQKDRKQTLTLIKKQNKRKQQTGFSPVVVWESEASYRLDNSSPTEGHPQPDTDPTRIQSQAVENKKCRLIKTKQSNSDESRLKCKTQKYKISRIKQTIFAVLASNHFLNMIPPGPHKL